MNASYANIVFQRFCAAENDGPPGKLVYRCGDQEIYEVDGDVDTVRSTFTFVESLGANPGVQQTSRYEM
jgi:hypothetical protein